MDNPYVIALLFTLAVGLFFYIIVVPKTGRRFTQGDYGKAGRAVKTADYVGNELYSLLPQSLIKERRIMGGSRLSKVETLFQRSANPWNLKPHDFTFFKVIFAVLGLVLGTVAGVVIQVVIPFIPWFVVTIGGAFLGWIYPSSTYNAAAKKRDVDFKRQLPEALDLIIISLSSGMPFAPSVRESIPNMQPGILREEFVQLLKTIDAGASLSVALQSFASRAPNDSITTFIKAVQEATELNVPLIDVLQSRSEASRKDFFALIHQKTATLSSRMMMVLTPTLIPAIMICVLAPAAFSLLGSLG